MGKVAKNNTSLKITYSNKIKHDIDYYFGKHFKVKTIITDADGDKYESEIIMQPNWGKEQFTNTQTIIFAYCDAKPVQLHLVNFTLLD